MPPTDFRDYTTGDWAKALSGLIVVALIGFGYWHFTRPAEPPTVPATEIAAALPLASAPVPTTSAPTTTAARPEALVDAQATAPRLPAEEIEFGRAITVFYIMWKIETNELRRADLLSERGASLLKAMKNKDAFTEWEMEVVQIKRHEDGTASVALAEIGPQKNDPCFFLMNLPVTPNDNEKLRFSANSPLFQTAKSLSAGDHVIASGSFLPNKAMGFFDGGAILGTVNEERFKHPAFAVRFTSLREI